MSEQTEAESALAAILIEALDLEDISASEIQPTAPLFGFDEPSSLGLDSIDALEIALAINQNYSVQIQADDENNKAVFATLRSLMQYIQENQD